MKLKFYFCEQCGNCIIMLKNSGVPVVCCGMKMVELAPNTVDAAEEKHRPFCRIEGDTAQITVGYVEHPMKQEHYIEWIVLCTDKGSRYKWLSPGEPPKARFALGEGEQVQAVYAYCNLHGLWKL